jgi:hypothetical protein
MASKVQHSRRIPWRLLGWGGAAALLLLPLIAMRFTSEVNWTPADFIFAGSMFALVGGTFELVVRRSGSGWYRGGVAVALGTALLLVWINGAVGIVGDEQNPANLMFLGVIAIALAGSIVCRFRPAGMALAMVLAAAAQALVAVIAFVFRLGADQPPFFPGVIILIAAFSIAWLSSAWLFRNAAHQDLDAAGPR